MTVDRCDYSTAMCLQQYWLHAVAACGVDVKHMPRISDGSSKTRMGVGSSPPPG